MQIVGALIGAALFSLGLVVCVVAPGWLLVKASIWIFGADRRWRLLLSSLRAVDRDRQLFAARGWIAAGPRRWRLAQEGRELELSRSQRLGQGGELLRWYTLQIAGLVGALSEAERAVVGDWMQGRPGGRGQPALEGDGLAVAFERHGELERSQEALLACADALMDPARGPLSEAGLIGRALGHSDPATRALCRQVLAARCGGRVSEAALVERARAHPDPEVRVQGALAARDWAEVAAIARGEEVSDRVRVEALQALPSEALPTEERAALLARCLGAGGPARAPAVRLATRSGAAAAEVAALLGENLERLQAICAISRLRARADERWREDWALAAALITWLGRRGPEAEREGWLLHYLAVPDERIRRDAALALQRVGGVGAVPALSALAAGTNRPLAELALVAVRTIQARAAGEAGALSIVGEGEGGAISVAVQGGAISLGEPE